MVFSMAVFSGFGGGHLNNFTGANILEFLSCENIESNKMDFSMAVFSGFGGGHLNNFTGAILNHDKSTFTESGTLHGIGCGSSGISSSEIIFSICHGSDRVLYLL